MQGNHLFVMKNIMSQHPSVIAWYDSLEQLARDLWNLQYDSLAELLKLLADDLDQQAQADIGRWRMKLAWHLSETSQALRATFAPMDRAWKICEPFMED